MFGRLTGAKRQPYSSGIDKVATDNQPTSLHEIHCAKSLNNGAGKIRFTCLRMQA